MYPPHAQFTSRDLASHDFAMGLLKVGVDGSDAVSTIAVMVLGLVQEPAVFSATVGPICLPRQGDQHGGLQAVAAGWGRWHMDSLALHCVLTKVLSGSPPLMCGLTRARC